MRVYSALTDMKITFRENRDKVEVYLAFGASRVEACRPIAIEALRLALTPTINNMRYDVSFHPLPRRNTDSFPHQLVFWG